MEQENSSERRDAWKFLITEEGWLWAVTRPDGTEEKAPQTFKTLKLAADSAMEHGYAAWRSSERRSVRN